MKTALIIALGLAVAGQVTWAGQEGHGGRVLRCEVGTGTDGKPQYRYDLLDYYMAEHPESDAQSALQIDLSAGSTEIEKIRAVLSRLSRLDPDRARIYLRRAEKFMTRATIEVETVQFAGLRDMREDQAIPFYAEKCAIMQVINRISDRNNYPVFHIAGGTWALLPTEVRAGLILHEIAYGDASDMGQQYADLAMQFTAMISSTELGKITPERWLRNYLPDYNLGFYFSDFLIESQPRDDKERPQFYPDTGRLKSGLIAYSHEMDVNQGSLYSSAIQFKGHVDFFPDGKLAAAGIEAEQNLETKKLWIPKDSIDRVAFDPTGKMITLYTHWLSAPLPFNQDSTSSTELIINGTLLFDSEGNLYSATSAIKQRVLLASGKQKTYGGDDQIVFNRDGKAVRDGIYSTTTADSFIQIARKKGKIGFAFCRYVSPETCEQIGREKFYPIGKIKHYFKSSMHGDGSKLQEYVSLGTILGSFALPFPVVALLGNGWVGALSGIGATVATQIFGWHLQNTSDFFNGFALKRQLFHGRYVITQLPIEQVKTELEQSLAKI